MKDAKEIRQYYISAGEGSTLGPACHGCGKMENESNPPTQYGYCWAFDDEENGWSVICPDCGTVYWGYYIWIDPDGTKAVWPFDDPEDASVKCDPEHIPINREDKRKNEEGCFKIRPINMDMGREVSVAIRSSIYTDTIMNGYFVLMNDVPNSWVPPKLISLRTSLGNLIILIWEKGDDGVYRVKEDIYLEDGKKV